MGHAGSWQSAEVASSLSEPRSVVFDAGTLDLHYLDYGSDAQAGTPVVLLHGHTDSAWSWHHISSRLAADHRVVALDLRGHGDSGRGSPSAQHLAGDLAAVIEHAELDRPAILAHSLGAHMATQFCGAFPDAASRLALVEGLGPPRVGEVSDGEWRQVTADRITAARMAPRRRTLASLEDARARFARQHPRLPSEILDPLVERLTRPVEGGFEWKFDPLTRDWLTTHDHERAELLWQGVACPVLVVLGAESHQRFWSQILPPGMQDREEGFTTEELDRRLACFADHRLVELDDCGHMIHYERPDALYGVVAPFLAG